MQTTILFESILIGALAGLGVGAGAARMFHAPKIQAAGAFRTLGEMNACLGDPVSHFSFGFSFLINCAVNDLAVGCVTQDLLHRVVPNFAAGLLTIKNKKIEDTVQNPLKMGLAGSVVGAVFYTLLNMSVSLVPVTVSSTMQSVLTPAITNMMLVMDILYILAAIQNGKYTGTWGLILGAVSRMVVGSATPGAILGILTGKTIELNGIKSKVSIIFIVLMVVLWLLVAYFRGFFVTMASAFGI